MNDREKQKKQIFILVVLLVIICLANYKNYIMPISVGEVPSFQHLTKDEQDAMLKGINKAPKVESENKKETSSVSEDNSATDVRDVSFGESDDIKKGENYLNYALDSSGKLVKWNKKNIKVYIEPNSEYESTIIKALETYNEYFKGYFKFSLVDSKNLADLTIYVVDKFDSNNGSNEMYMAGLTNNTFAGSDNHLSKSRIQLLSKKPGSNEKMSKNGLYSVLMHELGHAIGVIGHSPNKYDAMYAFTEKNKGTLTSRDRTTIKMMYAGDSSVIASQTKNFSEIKLKEATSYVNANPNKALSWVNLGKVYYDSGNKEKAIEAYKKALTIEPGNYFIYQSMAECYYASQKYDTAIKYYLLAIDRTKTDEEKVSLYNMVGLSYAKKEDYANSYTYMKKSFDLDKRNKLVLQNLLVTCVQLDMKRESLQYIQEFKDNGGIISPSDQSINDVIDWAKK